MTITAPYTFVPFLSPPIRAKTLWDHDGCRTDPTRAFDQVLPGLLSGHVDLTLTACSGLYVGGGATTGSSFRWPGPDGRYAIPGPSIRGMLRSHVEALTGAALGLGERDQVLPTMRFPVSIRSPHTAAERTLNEANAEYRQRRGPDTASPGKQRAGILRANPETGQWEVQESPQFILPLAGQREDVWPRKMPAAQWRLVVADLLADVTGDRRQTLKELRGTVVSAVWAVVTVNAVPRPCIIGLGRSAAAAEAAALTRTSAGEAAPALAQAVPAGTSVAFTGDYLDQHWAPCGHPVARDMMLFPTNLANLTPTGAATDTAANCYLLLAPGDVPPGGHAGHNAPLPLKPLPLNSPSVAEEFLSILQMRASLPWTPAAPVPALLTGWPTTPGGAAFPVFFDAEGAAVTHLGAAGGFAIRTLSTVKDAVRNARGSWAGTLDPVPGKNHLANVLFGAIDITTAIRGRIEVGHATATAELTPLTSRPAALFTPHLQSASTRLAAPRGTRVSFDDPTPAYRGRQFYWHRGHWSGTGEDTWSQHVHEHLATFATNNEQVPDADRAIAPLPVGATFTSRITFTNLTPSELGLLMFALTFTPTGTGVEAAPVFAHKLGGGKPLGLGSTNIGAVLTVHGPDRYTHPRRSRAQAGAVAGGVDPGRYVEAFLTAVGWTAADADQHWRPVPETGRRWPAHVAAWLLVHRWNPRPHPDHTRETNVTDFRAMTPMEDVFTIASHTS